METTKVKKVFGNRVLVKPDEAKEVTDSGIIIPDIAKKNPPMGTIEMVGSFCRELSIGMRVFYTGGAAAKISVGKEQFHVMRETDAVMELDGDGKLLRLFGDRVLVDPDETASKTDSGVIIPDAFKDESSSGTVKAVGALVKQTTKETKIIFGKQAGHYIQVDGKEYLVMREDDIVMEV